MRQQLIQYVDLLFAGAHDCEDIKQEILQNTLDRYDDLIADGKVPEAAYRLAISGIGDINAILGDPGIPASPVSQPQSEKADPIGWARRIRAVAIFVYIICPIPLIAMSEAGYDLAGVCMLLVLVGLATMLMYLSSKKQPSSAPSYTASPSPEENLRKSIGTAIKTAGLVIYFLVSFLTRAWFITWLIFPITAAVRQLVQAIFDLKEADKYEN